MGNWSFASQIVLIGLWIFSISDLEKKSYPHHFGSSESISTKFGIHILAFLSPHCTTQTPTPTSSRGDRACRTQGCMCVGVSVGLVECGLYQWKRRPGYILRLRVHVILFTRGRRYKLVELMVLTGNESGDVVCVTPMIRRRECGPEPGGGGGGNHDNDQSASCVDRCVRGLTTSLIALLVCTSVLFIVSIYTCRLYTCHSYKL